MIQTSLPDPSSIRRELMEVLEDCSAGGGRGIRDLPPSKRFRFVGGSLASNPCVPLPAKKRAFPPPAGAAAVSACLPAKKRAYVPAPAEEDAVKVCLPAKKRAYVAPLDAAAPACLPASKRVQPPPRREDAAGSFSAPARKHAPPLLDGAALWPPIPVKKRSPAAMPPPPPEAAAGLFPVSLPANKRVMPPFVLNDKRSEDQAGAFKKSEHAVDPKAAAMARQEESLDEDEDATGELKEAMEEEDDDDGVLCAVCGSTDGDPSDPIVFCDGCDLMVHASCYGNPLAQSIPDGDWFCSLCSDKPAPKTAARHGRSSGPRCRLCPARGGAMKRTTDGAWAHIACALLVPEVFFQDPDGRDGVDCSGVPARRFKAECYVCESSRGCALECSQPKCGLRFHVSCGLTAGLCIEYRESKGAAAAAIAVVSSFCGEHTKLWEKQQVTGKYKIVPRDH